MKVVSFIVVILFTFLTAPMLILPQVVSAFELEVSADSILNDLGSNERTDLKAGAKSKVSERNPIWITAPGKIPVLLIPLSAQGSNVKVDSPNIDKVISQERDLRIDSALSEVMLFMMEIHRAIAQRNLVLATQKVTALRVKYPDLKFLNFVEASVAFLSGDRAKALSLVNLGLSAHPDYVPGIELKRQLGGETSQ